MHCSTSLRTLLPRLACNAHQQHHDRNGVHEPQDGATRLEDLGAGVEMGIGAAAVGFAV